MFDGTEDWLKKLKKNWFVVSKMTRIWWNLIWALKSPKNLHYDMSFPVMFDLKKSSGVIFHDTREWCKIWRKTDFCFQKWHEEFEKFSPEHLKVSKLGLWWDSFVQSWTFMSLKLQGSYVSWQWRMMQKLKRNWLVSSKLTWGIWQILTRALENLKNLHFNGLLLNKVYNVWAKKSIEELCLMALKTDAKFEGKMTSAF